MRAGGKHNDLDNVGYTARHHTFFEMLGNFSFGDYFKEQAIELAWTLITQGIRPAAKDRLTVTVYSEDDEAFGLWKKIAGLPATTHHPHRRPRTISGRWAIPAPAVPARRSSSTTATTSRAARPARPTHDGDRFIEIWNLVFMQFEQVRRASERDLLPRPSIDTGMGLERIAAVLQGAHDNYDIDLFRALIRAVGEAHRRSTPDGAARRRATASSPTICARRAS